MSVKFIYFDLGKVLLLFSVSRLLYQVSELTGISENEIATVIFSEKKYIALESGEISLQEYFMQVSTEFNRKINPADFLEATNNIFWVNESLLPVIRKLAKVSFPRGILSNTGPQHWLYIQEVFPFITNIFPHHRIASYEVKCMKPNPKIYRIALEEARTEIPDLKPEEVLFIDDLEENVQGAIKFGFQSVVYSDTEHLIQDLQQLGIPIPTKIDG